MNREIVAGGGAVIYPLQGDVESTAGSQNVTVVGLQGISVEQGIPNDASVLTYVQSANQWQPQNANTVVSTHSESLTDGNANFIFAATLSTGGDIITVVGVTN